MAKDPPNIFYLVGKNANYYETVAGVNIISSDAVMVSGEYIDIMRGTDALQADIEESTFNIDASKMKQ